MAHLNGKNLRFCGQWKTLRIHVRERKCRELGHTTATVSIAKCLNSMMRSIFFVNRNLLKCHDLKVVIRDFQNIAKIELFFCDGCKQESNKRIGFDGDYVHFPNSQKIWNASWLCLHCLQSVYQNQCSRRISLEEVKEKLGIAKQQSSEIARRQKRTNGGTERSNPKPSRHLPLPPPKRARLYV